MASKPLDAQPTTVLDLDAQTTTEEGKGIGNLEFLTHRNLVMAL